MSKSDNSMFDVKSAYIDTLDSNGQQYKIFSLAKACAKHGVALEKLPYSLRVLLENVIRHPGGDNDVRTFVGWINAAESNASIPENDINFMPARVLMQDLTGVPAVVDLAAMREAMTTIGGNAQSINPLIPVDLVIDHSVQVDFAGDVTSFKKNVELEFQRNKERYEFLRWGQYAFNNFRVVPPGTGICHQVNLEYIAQVVWTAPKAGVEYAYPDTLVGTDSHTTMINGLGVLGWGVGGIEAEAAMLGQPLPMLLPKVVGFKLTGKISEGITATDIVLTVTEILRKKGVVGKFVEFFGPGLSNLSLADRATIANIAPEYGATCGFFAVDDETIAYLKLTSRDADRVELVEKYCKAQKLWRDGSDDKVVYSEVMELDLSSVVPSLAGPKRPQDRLTLNVVSSNFKQELANYEPDVKAHDKSVSVISDRGPCNMKHGNIVIAAITSCTNTSNPAVLIAAGLVAKKACDLGLNKKPWVKTSLAPGSQVVTDYLKATGLMPYLEKIGFNVVGYGCTTCIGNSGPLHQTIEKAIVDEKLVVSSVLSGNRNFEGRVHPLVRANYLASPPLVVAYSLAGNVMVDLDKDPIGVVDGKNIYLKDIWPSQKEIQDMVNMITKEMFKTRYENVFLGDEYWQNIQINMTNVYHWNNDSTYIKNPPYFDNILDDKKAIADISGARILAVFGDSITTDHISPAGNISKTSPAAKYLLDKQVSQVDFNSYGARRGNHEVMMRGTFANIRIKNKICNGVEGGVTKYFTDADNNGADMAIFDAAMKYKDNNVGLVIFAGKEYGTGSSRDWAAKGTALLGVKAVIAESFERIHRSNLVGMGVLPLCFEDGVTAESLQLKGNEKVSIEGLVSGSGIAPSKQLQCTIHRVDGNNTTFNVKLMVMTTNEVDYIKHGSILHKVVRACK